MPIYLVERDVPGLSRAQFDSAHRATIEAALRSTADGLAVRYLRGVFVPSEGRAVCLFEGPDADSVRAVNVAAGVPFSSVSEALELATELGRSLEGDPCASS
jgi:hypothetical protein